MKKIVALALCLVMVIGLMTGCQKAMDAKTLVQKMDEAMKTVTEIGADAEIDMEMKLGASGVTMGMDMGMDMGMKTKTDFSQLYANTAITMEMLGQTEEVSMEMYGCQEDGDMVVYAYESESDSWVKTTMADFAELMVEAQAQAQGEPYSAIPVEKLTLDKEKVTINDRECYVLTVDLDGEYFKSYMDENMDEAFAQMDEEMAKAEAEMSEEEFEQVKSMMEAIKNLDWSTLSAKSVYHVDAETFLPVEMTVEILGLGETMQSIMTTLLAELMIELDSTELEFTIDVPTFKLAAKNMTYNEAVEIPDVPQEAIDNAIDADEMAEEEFVVDESLLTNPAQADGSYLLTLAGSSIRVMPPEGYVGVDSAEDYVYLTDDPMMYENVLCYGLATDMDSEALNAAIMGEIDLAKEGEYYKSHADQYELDGYQVMGLVYDDDTSIWYAWKELDGCCFLMTAEVAGESCDLSALLTAVEFVAE